jgi:hypothetical protein
VSHLIEFNSKPKKPNSINSKTRPAVRPSVCLLFLVAIRFRPTGPISKSMIQPFSV